MSSKNSFQTDLTRTTRHPVPERTHPDLYFSKRYPTNYDKYSISVNSLIPQQNKFSATSQDFLGVKRLPERISSIRETFSFNPISFSKSETDQKLRSNKSKNQRLKELLNIAIDLQNLQKKSSQNYDPSKLSVPGKVFKVKPSKSQVESEQKTASFFDQKRNNFYGQSEKQIKPYLRTKQVYNYDKSHSVTVEQQIQKIRQQNQKRKSENAKPTQNQQHSFYKIKTPTTQSNQTIPKKQHLEFHSPKQQKPAFLKTLNTINKLSPSYEKKKLETSFEIKIRSPREVRQFQTRKNSFSENKKQLFQNVLSDKICIDDFKMVKVLGKGRFGIVHLASHKVTGGLFAIKVIKKQTIKANKLVNQFILEVKLQSYLNHPFILRIFAIFDDQENIYLVMEYLQQGCLFHYLKNSKNKKLQERDAAQKVKYLAESIKYLQDRGIAHRDIKPQNIIMNQGVCKLADFGWATFCDEERRRTYCGTCDYVAPQILQGQQYDETVDLWCIGVLAYELVAGKAPFYHMSQKQTRNKIINANIIFPEDFSQHLKSFISGLVQKDPERRMTIEEALSHPFINSVNLCQ